MPKILTPEEKKKYIEDLNKISKKVYDKGYRELCGDRVEIVKQLYKSGYLDDE